MLLALHALHALRSDDKGAVAQRLRRGLQALAEHAPSTWDPLFASCGVAVAAASTLAAPVALPRTLGALTGLLGVQQQEEGGADSGPKRPAPGPAAARQQQRARTRASSTAAAAAASAPAAMGLDPVHVLPAEAMVHVFRFLGYRCALVA